MIKISLDIKDELLLDDFIEYCLTSKKDLGLLKDLKQLYIESRNKYGPEADNEIF